MSDTGDKQLKDRQVNPEHIPPKPDNPENTLPEPGEPEKFSPQWFDKVAQNPDISVRYHAYREVMAEALLLHINKRYPEVLELRQRAVSLLLCGSPFTLDPAETEKQFYTLKDPKYRADLAALFRNIGATYERLGNDQNAEAAMRIAEQQHTRLVDVFDSKNQKCEDCQSLQGDKKDKERCQTCREDKASIHRELAADQFYLGSFALKQAILAELEGKDQFKVDMHATKALEYIHKAQASFETARQSDPDALPHQYELNALRRFALAEALYGDAKRGREIAKQARKWAVYSEPGLPESERKKAVEKVRLAALGALAVGMASGIGLRRTSLRLALKLL